MRLHLIAAAAASLLMSDIAFAQAPATTPGAAPPTSAPAATPSRSRTRTPAAQAPAATQPATAAPAAGSEATTGRRQRSPAQLRNDQIMRDCGAEWRGQRDQLRAQGKTWRSFLQECRQRRRG
ncbi:hypothetical protein [Phreatobacter sp. AB_2022a]|uniref:hypothetical protein n=1 Tax=Phreatobacter sp. AB_2022a TaxID=3003134 RepID=UPI0022872938|nr:hypothetical protein [Phreatobacter sp. AB_2022a]MCZ0736521.1 hypothetical protein [Phreatobacter sp. AB_2022a]